MIAETLPFSTNRMTVDMHLAASILFSTLDHDILT